jgi:hypothetical protein
MTLLTAGGLLAQTPPPPPTPPALQPAPDSGVDPLTRGPIHEAFAEPDTTTPDPSPIIPNRPPDGIDEIPPDQRPDGANVAWIPGYWAWDDDTGNFVWVSGFWRDVPPDRQWVPGYWIAVEGGYQWVHGYWGQAGVQDVSYLPPPPASLETGPSVPAPDNNSLYIPGCWIYQDTRYLWRPGFWAPANPNWVYCPPRYTWTPAGYVFADGYWDYPLDRRGLLFCPVQIAPALLARPDFAYQPAYAVSTPALVTALFVDRDFHRYQFGDYFDPQYARRGVVPWFEYRAARNVVSPLFAHYRWEHRTDRQWLPSLERLYQERISGVAPRPPESFRHQDQLLRDLTANQSVRINGRTVRVSDPRGLAQHLQVVAPLREAPRLNNVKLRPVPALARTQQQRAAAAIRTAATKRRDVESRLVAEGHHPTRPTDKARTARIELPHTARAVPPTVTGHAPPPAPRLPAHVERPLPKHEPAVPKRVAPRPVTRPAVPPHPQAAVKGRPEPQPPRPTPAAKPHPAPAPPPQPAHPAPAPHPQPPRPAPAAHPKPQPAPAPHPQPPRPAPAPHPQPPRPAPAPAVHPQPPRPAPAAHPQPPHPAPAPHPQPAHSAPAPHPQPPRPAPAAHPQPPHPAPAAHPQPPRPAPAAHPQPPHPAPAPHPQPPRPAPAPHPQPHPAAHH